MQLNSRRRQAGFNLLEVLVSLLIVTVGLLGLAGVQVVAQRAEQESYQRAQAMVLMSDIVDRMNTNRKVAVCYAITDAPTAGTKYLGTPPASGSGKYDPAGFSCPSMSTNPTAVKRAGLDLQLFDKLLLGSGETLSSAKVGSIIGARACIGFNTNAQAYTVAIAWQGTTSTFSPATWTAAPDTAKYCGKDLYGAEQQRRVVWTSLAVASLQ